MKRGKCKYGCMGGKMKYQEGAIIPTRLFAPPQPTDDEFLPTEDIPLPEYENRIQEGIDKGLLEPPRADRPDSQYTSQQWYNLINTPPDKKRHPATPKNWQQNLGIGMMGLRTLLSEISGRVARGRQNQYDYMQQAALGQMNPMPTSDYQPNPYSLYAKYGGKLKTYQQGGMKPNYNFWPKYDGNKELIPNRDDSVRYDWYFNGIINNDPFYLGQEAKFEKYGVPNVGPHGGAPDPLISFNDWSARRAMQDARGQQQRKIAENWLNVSINPKKEQKYGGLQHAKYFGPPFSNGANYKFSDEEKYDRYLANRHFRRMLQHMGMKTGGIHIKPQNKGKFTDYCGGKVTSECIEQGLNSPSATIRKRANFARNARKWKH